MTSDLKLSLDPSGIRRLVHRTILRNEGLDLRLRVDPETLRASVKTASLKPLDGLEAQDLPELLKILALYLTPETSSNGTKRLSP